MSALAHPYTPVEALLEMQVTSVRTGSSRKTVTLLILESSANMAAVARQGQRAREQGSQVVVVSVGKLAWGDRGLLTPSTVLLEVDSFLSLPVITSKILAAICRGACSSSSSK